MTASVWPPQGVLGSFCENEGYLIGTGVLQIEGVNILDSNPYVSVLNFMEVENMTFDNLDSPA